MLLKWDVLRAVFGCYPVILLTRNVLRTVVGDSAVTKCESQGSEVWIGGLAAGWLRTERGMNTTSGEKE